jgi:hypothetical protein
VRIFAVALNVALGIVVVAWLHSSPHGYQAPIEPLWWDKVRADPNATFAGLVAIFTLLLTCIGFWQAKIASGQLKLTRTLERAYIAVEPDGIWPYRKGTPPKIPTDVTGRYFISNVGRLPARDVSWFAEITFSDNRKWKPDQSAPREFEGDVVVTPGTHMRRATRRVRSTEFMLFDGKKTKWCFVWGQVHYLDGFGDRRTTNFCHRYNCEALSTENIIGEIDARYHESGNDGT